jgi:hypothetical protein
MTKLVLAAAALKAERQRDMAQARPEYENEQDARRCNMVRLRAFKAVEGMRRNGSECRHEAKKKEVSSVKRRFVT